MLYLFYLLFKGVVSIMLDNNQIANMLRENNFKLLGQIEISEKDYKELIEFIGIKIKNM